MAWSFGACAVAVGAMLASLAALMAIAASTGARWPRLREIALVIVAFSIMVGKALQAADELAKAGIDAEVINLRSLRPLDTETIVASVKKTNRLVSVEEGWPFAGIGSELAAQMMEQAFDWLDAPVKRVHGLDVPLPYAANLEKMALPQAETIVEAARAVCNR